MRKAKRAGDKPRRNSTADYAPEPASYNSDHDVDVMNDTNEEEDEQPEDRHPEYPSASTNPSKKARPKASSHAPPIRKKTRKLVVSDSELSEEEEYKAPDDDVIPEADDADMNDDDFLSFAEKPTKSSKGKGKVNVPKVNTASKGTKRKAKADPDEGLSENKGSTSGVAKKRLKPSIRTDDMDVDVVDDSNDTPEAPATVGHSSPATTKHDSPVPLLLPKKKLPTIKKNKLPVTSGLNTPTSAGVPPKKVPLEIGGPKGIEERKKMTLRGQTDIDLSNQSVYQELFSRPVCIGWVVVCFRISC